MAWAGALLATIPRLGARQSDVHRRMTSAIGEGLRWLAGHRLLRVLAFLLGVNTFCFPMGNATLVLLATRTLGLDAAAYGLLLAAGAVGSVLGGMITARLVALAGERTVLLLALGVNAVAFLGVGSSPDPIALCAWLALSGCTTIAWNVVTVSLRQSLVPPELLGRVNSVYRMVGWGLIPLGALIGGVVGHAFGLRAPYLLADVVRALALVITAPTVARALGR